MGAVTHGDVLAGRARPEELVPFGGAQAHKAFALAVGLELLVGALAGPEHGVVLLVARPRRTTRCLPFARSRAGFASPATPTGDARATPRRAGRPAPRQGAGPACDTVLLGLRGEARVVSHGVEILVGLRVGQEARLQRRRPR